MDRSKPIKPTPVRSQTSRGCSRGETAQGSKALELVARAVKLDGSVPDLLDAQALAYMASGQSELAIKDLQDALALSPTALKYLHLRRPT